MYQIWASVASSPSARNGAAVLVVERPDEQVGVAAGEPGDELVEHRRRLVRQRRAVEPADGAGVRVVDVGPVRSQPLPLAAKLPSITDWVVSRYDGPQLK